MFQEVNNDRLNFYFSRYTQQTRVLWQQKTGQKKPHWPRTSLKSVGNWSMGRVQVDRQAVIGCFQFVALVCWFSMCCQLTKNFCPELHVRLPNTPRWIQRDLIFNLNCPIGLFSNLIKSTSKDKCRLFGSFTKFVLCCDSRKYPAHSTILIDLDHD